MVSILMLEESGICLWLCADIAAPASRSSRRSMGKCSDISTSLLVLEDSPTASKPQADSKPLPCARSAETVAPSLSITFRNVSGSETCGSSTQPSSMTSPQFTLLPQDFPAKTPALQTSRASGPMEPEQDYSGTPCGLLAILGADSSWRTSQGSLFEDSETFSQPWPLSGSMLSGLAYQHETPAQIISESDCGSCATPGARDGKDLSTTTAYLAARERHSPSLATQLLGNGVPWYQVSSYYEAAMGFPLQWSAAVYMGLAMRYARRSRKRSAKRSSKQKG